MFKNNLSKLKNERLSNSLSKLPISVCTSNIAFVNTLDGNVVFLKNEVPVEDPNGPITYVKSLITDKIKNLSTNDVVISFGFGVGYILDELFNSTKAKIVIYEPDIKYLRFIFETIDLTTYLDDKRVFISDDAEECIDFIVKRYLNEDKIEFVVSKILALFYKDETEKFSQLLYSKLKNRIVDINTIKVLSKNWVNNFVRIVKNEKKYYSLSQFRDKFAGKNALILAAGPSLADNIENIKLNRNRFVIFAVNRVLPILEENGIVPDFAVFTDAKDIIKRYTCSENYTAKLNAIIDCKAEAGVLDFRFNSIIKYFSDNQSFMKNYAKDIGVELFPSEATTTMMALNCAVCMNFDDIYFCGFDLAFKESKPYSTNETIDIKNGVAVINEEQKQIVEVMSVTGRMVQTREDYSTFIQSMETIIKTRNLKNLHNITDFGALINGMAYTSFDNINSYSVKPDINEIFYSLAPCKYDFKKYLEIEKQKMLSLHEKVVSMSPVNEVVNLIMDATLLYEYLQYEMLEFLREGGKTTAVDTLYSKTVLALDKLLAII